MSKYFLKLWCITFAVVPLTNQNKSQSQAQSQKGRMKTQGRYHIRGYSIIDHGVFGLPIYLRTCGALFFLEESGIE